MLENRYAQVWCKIKNLEQEKETREKEWKWEEEEDAAWWDEQYEKDMEREMNEYM